MLRLCVDPLEIGVSGLEPRGYTGDRLHELLRTPTPERIFAIGDALREGMPVDEIYALTAVDPWFLRQMRKIIDLEHAVVTPSVSEGPVRARQRAAHAPRILAHARGDIYL